MFVAARTIPTVSQRVRTMIIAGLLALSLLAGATATATQVDARKRQPQVACEHWTQQEWIQNAGEDPGVGGYWNCYFVTI